MRKSIRSYRSSRKATQPTPSVPSRLRDRFSTLELLENRRLLSTYAVTTTADSGAGSLREAIQLANANAGADSITFQVSGVISLGSGLDAITDAVTIDGGNQVTVDGTGAGFGANGFDVEAGGVTIKNLGISHFNSAGLFVGGPGGNTFSGDTITGNGVGVTLASAGNTLSGSLISGNGDAGVSVTGSGNQILNNTIGLDANGAPLGNQGNGVDLRGANNTTVRGNVIAANSGNGVRIGGGSGNVIAGNRIGTDASGSLAMGNQGNGVVIDNNASDNRIGGTSAADRNLVSGNAASGVYVASGAGAGNLVSGNYIGTDASGTAAISNSGDGVTVFGDGVTVSGNVISGNFGNGLSLYGNANTVTDNKIGTAADGASMLNGFGIAGFSDGLWVQGNNNVVGTPGHGNVIAYNSGSGIEVFLGAGNSLRGNSIHDNAYQGIDLGANGYTDNDSAGHDGSNNNYQNYPLITTLTNVNGVLTVSGTVTADPNSTYTVDLYATDAVTGDYHGQGRTWLGSVTVTTDGSGNGTFSLAVSNNLGGQGYVLTTATDATGNTSEFSLAADVPSPTFTNADTTTTLSSSADPSIIGQSVTFTAVVSPLSGTLAASGSVTFYEIINGVPQAMGTSALVNGVATLTTSALSVGDHSIVAVYNPDAGFNGSQSAALDQKVNQDLTVTLLSSDTTVSQPGQVVTFTATVTPKAGFFGTMTGTVSFFDVAPDGTRTLLGTASLNGTQAVFSTSSLSVGNHTIVANYSGDVNFQGSESNSVSETVKAPVTLGTISGHVFRDTSGNGLSADDTALGGVTVKLFTDSNHNGILDSADAVVKSTTTAADGSYSFGSLAAGKYFVSEVTPSGYVRTAPATMSYYVEQVNGASITAVDFDNYKQCSCSSNVVNITYVINGCKTVSNLRGQCHEGDTVTVKFTVLAGHTETLSFVSYTAPGSSFVASDAYKQAIYNYQTGTFTAGSTNKTFTMTVKIPKCYFQIDFVCGQMIDKFGPEGSNVFYSAQGRLFSADNGGTHSPFGITPIGGSVLNM